MIGELPSNRTRIRVLKVNGRENVAVIIRSAEVVSFQLHWLGKRSYICPGDSCAACEQSVGSRWSAFIGVDFIFGNPEKRRFGLLELTDVAYSCLRMLRDTECTGSFVGMRLIASRRSNRSPLRFDLSPSGEAIEANCKAFPHETLIDALATIYGLPSYQGCCSQDSWEASAMPAARMMISRALTRLMSS